MIFSYLSILQIIWILIYELAQPNGFIGEIMSFFKWNRLKNSRKSNFELSKSKH